MEVDSGIGVGAGPGTGVGASCCGRSASDILAFDPGAGLPLDSAESWFVLRVISVWRFYNNSVGGRSEKSVRSRTFSNGIRLPWKNLQNRFRLLKRIFISARMVSILVE